MKYTRIYTGNDEQSYFEECQLPLQTAELGQIAQSPLTSSAVFGVVEADFESDWHNPPCTQYVIMLNGHMEIETGHGEKKIFKEGDILLADDLTGKGHKTRHVGDSAGHYLALPISE